LVNTSFRYFWPYNHWPYNQLATGIATLGWHVWMASGSV